MAFTFQPLTIPEVVHITPDVHGDDRGYFLEVFKKSLFREVGIDTEFVQVNHSRSQKNVLRGLHYQQQPHAQAKLITVISGEIFDVAVDIRKTSPTFGQWASVRLSAADHSMVYIPIGFAHGFCALADNTEIIYYNSAEYVPEAEGGLAWNDPALKITWPIDQPVLSAKDQQYPPLASATINVA